MIYVHIIAVFLGVVCASLNLFYDMVLADVSSFKDATPTIVGECRYEGVFHP